MNMPNNSKLTSVNNVHSPNMIRKENRMHKRNRINETIGWTFIRQKYSKYNKFRV